MIEFNVEYTNKETLEEGSFKMVLEGLAFKFEDINSKKLINPFFCSDEIQLEIAKELFKEDSILLNNPKKSMFFNSKSCLVEVASESL